MNSVCPRLSRGKPAWLHSDKRIILSGASGGFGRELSSLLYQSGAKVVFLGRDADRLNSLISVLEQTCERRGGLHALIVDLRELNTLESVVDDACRLLGSSINVLINNAGIAFHASAENLNAEELNEVFSVNAVGPILLSARAFALM